jgi:hypothetical protein
MSTSFVLINAVCKDVGVLRKITIDYKSCTSCMETKLVTVHCVSIYAGKIKSYIQSLSLFKEYWALVW